jgi:hypothetical protein
MAGRKFRFGVSFLLVLMLVIVIGKEQIGHQHEPEHDYEKGRKLIPEVRIRKLRNAAR